MKPIRPRPPRRGVLLLVILGLLAMFGLVAMTFVVLTGQAKRGSIVASRAEVRVDSPPEVTHQSLLVVLRGGRDAVSPARAHSLLETMYGHGAERCVVSQASAACGGALIEVTVTGLPDSETWWRVGRVITLMEGPAKGLSTHIVGYNPTLGKLQLRAFREVAATSLTGSYRAIINGAAFSGRGFGFVAGQRPTDVALQPGHDDHAWNNAGGANVDYTAADPQNMALALAMPLPGAWPQLANGPVPVPIPSYHRADLVRYWMQRNSVSDWTALPSGTLKNIVLRPLPHPDLHPNFTGSNPYFDPTWDGMYSPQKSWDVDNDGDGIADSIWLDLGFPVRAMADGRLYKPLAAILCLDMDGRLNLNAHGSLMHVTYPYTLAANAGSDYRFANGAGGTSTLTLPRSQGWGPADVNLYSLLGNYTLCQRLFTGTAAHDGRYGASGVPGLSGADPLGWNKHCTYPANWNPASPGACRAYQSPPDIKGLVWVGLDPNGQPVHAAPVAWGADLYSDHPYEINLSPGAARGLPKGTAPDNPFSPAEQERVLRASDADAGQLPARLLVLTSPDGNPLNSVLLARRNEFTVEGWDAPYAPFAINPANPGQNVFPRHVAEMLKLKFNLPAANTNATAALLRGELLPPELLQGLPMDINRFQGDGLDNNNNNVIDEIEEATLETYPQRTAAGADATLSAAQVDLTGGVLADERLARQLYARYLYCLAMMVCDLDYLDTQFGGDRNLTCRYLAQWAVNVVDFRDRDSIMTCFEYDPAPFGTNGWRCDGDPATNDGITQPHVVWGCERPELLITEAVAFHDRRTQDLDVVGQTPNKKYAGGTGNDPHFDQKYVPQGSLFVELYNPWTDAEPAPGEFYYDRGASQWRNGVRLNQTTPGGDPVWRLLIVKDSARFTTDPDTAAAPVASRVVYFTSAANPNLDDGCGADTRFYTSRPMAPIPPGRYAVIGPGEPGDSGASITYLGGRNDTNVQDQVLFDAQCRRIRLTPAATLASQQVAFDNNGSGAGAMPAATEIQDAAAIVINQPRRLNVTEPDSGYPAPTVDGTSTLAPAYEPPYDEPLDTEDELAKSGTTTNYCVVHLQRLANPLQNYNADTNPYRTVDSMSADLHSFNGASDDPEPDGGHEEAAGNEISSFATWERGEKAVADLPGVNNVWRQEPLAAAPAHVPSTTDAGAATDTASFFVDKNLAHTLGYLNRVFGPPQSATGRYKGSPSQPFPWLTWNNRPFVSKPELLLVPGQKSSDLLRVYRVAGSGLGANQYSSFTDVPFPHLMNFFQTGTTSAGTHTAPLLYRILDYVRVPSPFVGTEVQVPPALAAGSTGHFFRPPFNRIPLYREPGKVNLNTLVSPSVGEGLVNFFPGLWDAPMWDKFVASRKGTSALGSSDLAAIQAAMLSHNPTLPSRFARPFRAWYGSYLTPASVTEQQEIEGTLLRSYTDTARRPLLENRNDQSGEQFYGNTDHNPYFRYQGFQKLGNLVTTRSNVFAVWVTVGYFEVTPWPSGANDAHRDGYQLGREVGIDTGEVRRHRAFYMIDRTIPVAFERGQDYNVENTILLKRFIE